MADNKKRHVVSYEKMPLKPELAAAFAEKYPHGLADYLNDLVKYPKPDGTFFYAVTIEVPDAIYLVKINVKVDDLTIELVPENSEALTVLNGSLSTKSIKAGSEKSGNFEIKVSGSSGDVVKANIVVTDADGNTWKTPVEITVK